MLGVFSTIGLFLLLVIVAGPAAVPKTFGSPLVRVTVGAAGAIVVAYLLGFATFAVGLPVEWMYPGHAEIEIVNRLGMMSVFNWRGAQMLTVPTVGHLPASLLWAGFFLALSLGLLWQAFRHRIIDET